MRTKEEIMNFIEERDNPDETYIKVQLSDLFDFFKITDEEIISRGLKN